MRTSRSDICRPLRPTPIHFLALRTSLLSCAVTCRYDGEPPLPESTPVGDVEVARARLHGRVRTRSPAAHVRRRFCPPYHVCCAEHVLWSIHGPGRTTSESRGDTPRRHCWKCPRTQHNR